ncbi:MAG: hypothetical protein KDE27_17870 [Planctomycetes bacterium]|nr:hypothetical protein [Planctomycetota bacterium]
MEPSRRPFLALLSGLFAAALAAQGQDPTDASERMERAVASWIGSDQTSPELVGAAVDAVLAAGKPGFARVGALLTETADAAREPKARGVRALATQLALAFLQQQTERPLVYAGKFLPVAPLQPFVGELYFSWLLDTPDWYPDTHRVQLVAALRDLQPKRPDDRLVDRVVGVVEDEAIEPEDLRNALALMLWQWGEQKYLLPRYDRLVQESVTGTPEERVPALFELADLRYEMRDYKAASNTYRTLIDVAKQADYPLQPYTYYASACVHALSGQIDRALEAFAVCVELQESPDVDRSHKVDRVVLEEDPEIAALRADPRFPPLLERALKHAPKAKSGH